VFEYRDTDDEIEAFRWKMRRERVRITDHIDGWVCNAIEND